MQIFDRRIHLLTRSSAAVFSVYIMLNTKNRLIFFGAIIMFFFDVYTFCKT